MKHLSPPPLKHLHHGKVLHFNTVISMTARVDLPMSGPTLYWCAQTRLTDVRSHSILMCSNLTYRRQVPLNTDVLKPDLPTSGPTLYWCVQTWLTDVRSHSILMCSNLTYRCQVPLYTDVLKPDLPMSGPTLYWCAQTDLPMSGPTQYWCVQTRLTDVRSHSILMCSNRLTDVRSHSILMCSNTSFFPAIAAFNCQHRTHHWTLGRWTRLNSNEARF